MRVQTSQLREGYILLNDVTGKSGQAIMRGNTVLTAEHIEILEKFLVPTVEVTTTPVYAEDTVKLEQQQLKDVEKKVEQTLPVVKEVLPFIQHYLEVVESFKKEYLKWNNGVPIDIANVRKMIIPLLDRVEDLDIEVYTLYDFVEPEEYIYHHAVSVSLVSTFIAKELGFSKGEALQVGLAGILCDAGMTRVDKDILTKVGPLTEKQQQDIHNHPIYSSRMVENLPTISRSVKLAILQHHERMNGTGYPEGKSGDDIHLFARILAVSDTYDAMASERFYKKRQTVYQVFAAIEREQYSNFDPKVVQAFIRSLSIRSLGKRVELSNGRIGEIVFVNESNPTRPLIKMDDTKEIISLMEKINLEILRFII